MLCVSVLTSILTFISLRSINFRRRSQMHLAGEAKVSLSVGWGWIESATSRTVQPISIATTASAISSPAPDADNAATEHAVGSPDR